MLRHIPRIGAIAVICGLDAFVVVCMVTLLSPRSLAGASSQGWSSTPAPSQASGEPRPPRSSVTLSPEVPAPAAVLDVQPFATTLDMATAAPMPPRAAIADRPADVEPTLAPAIAGATRADSPPPHSAPAAPDRPKRPSAPAIPTAAPPQYTPAPTSAPPPAGSPVVLPTAPQLVPTAVPPPPTVVPPP